MTSGRTIAQIPRQYMRRDWLYSWYITSAVHGTSEVAAEYVFIQFILDWTGTGIVMQIEKVE